MKKRETLVDSENSSLSSDICLLKVEERIIIQNNRYTAYTRVKHEDASGFASLYTPCFEVPNLETVAYVETFTLNGKFFIFIQ